MKLFPVHCTDGYKLGHRGMYAPDTTLVYSNFTPRSDSRFNGSRFYDGKMVVFGIQGFINEFLVEVFNENFFAIDKEKAVARFRRRVDNYLTPGSIPVDGIAALHDLGYLPLEIMALPEGSRVPMKVPVLTVRNTHKDFAWLVNYLESVISNSIWKSMVNATLAYEYRRVFDYYADLTGSPKELVMWQGHDFSYRGMSGPEDGARSGAAHLLCFAGTDSVSAIDYIEDYYGADVEHGFVVGSVPATEHSVSSNNILFEERKYDGDVTNSKICAEIAFMRRYLTEVVADGAIASYVADTYDYFGVLTRVLPALKDVIMSRSGKLVIRPDSGDPVKIVCGYDAVVDVTDLSAMTLFKVYHNNCGSNVAVRCDDKYYKIKVWREPEDEEDRVVKAVEISEAEVKGSIQILWELFGGTTTDKGFKLLDSHIGLIYGDSITLDRQDAILRRLAAKGFASANVVFGIGSYTYNYSTRDTFGSAMKATMSIVDGEAIELYKDPKTGDAMKKSARGFLKVEKVDGEFVLVDQVEGIETYCGEMSVVFYNGNAYCESFYAIQDRLLSS